MIIGREKNYLDIIMNLLAWEPSVAQDTHSYSRRKLKTFLWFSRVPKSKFEANRFEGFLSYDRTNK